MNSTESATELNTVAPAQVYAPIRKAAVLGAGTMGAQIAAHLANAGLEVILLDIAPGEGPKSAIVEKGLERARKMKPDPFFTAETHKNITTGNFDEDLDLIAEVEWIVEAVVERLDVKRDLMQRVEALARPETIVSTNTSGIPIAAIADGRSESFRKRFLGTHFFNPPRYLKLLEIVPSEDTDREVVMRMAQFARVHLGKGVVLAKDSPYFIGNRIGVYAMMQAMRAFADGRYSIEEIDALTGPIAGRPKSATFRTADVVGLDVMLDVAQNLYEAVPDDESRDAFLVPDVLRALVDTKRLGQKTGAGFYKKEGKEIRSIDPVSMEYSPPQAVSLDGLAEIEKMSGLEERLEALYADPGRSGEFFRRSVLDLLAYAARRIPEIADNPADVDRALKWGFGWQRGPFETWDVLGFEKVLDDMQASGLQVPEWVLKMARDGRQGFYETEEGRRNVYAPAEGAFVEDVRPADQLSLEIVKLSGERTIWSSSDAALIDLGDGVALYEFRSKANTLGRDVMEGLLQSVRRVENDRSLKGMVVANEGTSFSVGANLVELALSLREEQFDEIESFVADFQETIRHVRYARKPVVVAAHQRVLGGGCEMVMACPNPVASAETYMGLVELGVGLIPAGTGTATLAVMASERSATRHPSEIQLWLRRFFETVAMAGVSTSAAHAKQLGFLAPHAPIVMNDDRRIYVASEEVRRLSSEGYFPPQMRRDVVVLGRPTGAAFDVIVQQYLEGGFISEYDAFLARRFAYVLTGGPLTGAQEVHEDYLLDLEREVFMELVRRKKTQERVEYMLANKKPLRN